MRWDKRAAEQERSWSCAPRPDGRARGKHTTRPIGMSPLAVVAIVHLSIHPPHIVLRISLLLHAPPTLPTAPCPHHAQGHATIGLTYPPKLLSSQQGSAYSFLYTPHPQPPRAAVMATHPHKAASGSHNHSQQGKMISTAIRPLSTTTPSQSMANRTPTGANWKPPQMSSSKRERDAEESHKSKKAKRKGGKACVYCRRR